MNPTARGSAAVMTLLDPGRNGRIRRTLSLLADDGWSVTVISPTFAKGSNAPSHHRFVPFAGSSETSISAARFLSRFFIFLARSLGRSPAKASTSAAQNLLGLKQDMRLRVTEFDLVIVEDTLLLSWVLDCRKGKPVIYDARDLSHRLFEERKLWRATIGHSQEALLRDLLPQCAEVITVSRGLADTLMSDFGVPSVVVRSIPDNGCVPPSPPPNGSPLRLVYMGRADRNRGLTHLVDAVGELGDQWVLDLYVVGLPAEINTLKAAALRRGNVRVLPPVPFDQIGVTLASYDLGYVAYTTAYPNLKHSLPNKFFEYVVSGVVPIVSSDSDMAKEASVHNCALVVNVASVNGLVESLGSLDSTQLTVLKQGVAKAQSTMTWESESKRLSSLVNRYAKK